MSKDHDRYDNRPDRDSDAMWADFNTAERAEMTKSGLVRIPDDRDELIGLVGDALRDKFDKSPTLDGDRDYVLKQMGQPVWVHVRRDQPVITVFARVAHGVYSRRTSEVEIGILNRYAVHCKWSLTGRSVYQETAMVGIPFVPIHFSILLDDFFKAMSATRDDLAYRIGAKVA